MALTTFNLALPVKFVAIPLLAGLAAGTGAVAAYVTAPVSAATASAATHVAALPGRSTGSVTTEQTNPAKPSTKPSCERETWPYIDNRCITQRGNEPVRQVRFVMAPRAGDGPNTAAALKLVTSDTVLRGPGVAPEANEQPAVKKPTKRSETRRQRREQRRLETVYAVPSARGTQPVIVVRPLRLNYSSRF